MYSFIVYLFCRKVPCDSKFKEMTRTWLRKICFVLAGLFAAPYALWVREPHSTHSISKATLVTTRPRLLKSRFSRSHLPCGQYQGCERSDATPHCNACGACVTIPFRSRDCFVANCAPRNDILQFAFVNGLWRSRATNRVIRNVPSSWCPRMSSSTAKTRKEIKTPSSRKSGGFRRAF